MGFNIKHVTKFTAVICSCLLIIVSVISFAQDALSPISAILNIYYIINFILEIIIANIINIIFEITIDFLVLLLFVQNGIQYILQIISNYQQFIKEEVYSAFCKYFIKKSLGTILLDDSSDKGSQTYQLNLQKYIYLFHKKVQFYLWQLELFFQLLDQRIYSQGLNRLSIIQKYGNNKEDQKDGKSAAKNAQSEVQDTDQQNKLIKEQQGIQNNA